MISKKNKLRRIILRRLTVFWKLVIFWAVIGFSKNFTVKAKKCNYHGENKIIRRKRWYKSKRFKTVFEAFDSILQIGHCFLRNGVQQEF